MQMSHCFPVFTCSGDPGDIKMRGVIHLEELLHNCSLVLPIPVHWAEEVFRIDVRPYPLESGAEEHREQHWDDEEVARMVTHDNPQAIEGFVEHVVHYSQTDRLKQRFG